MPYMLAFSRLLLSTIFFASSLNKGRQPLVFVKSITNYELIPRAWAKPFSFILIGMEIALAFLLFLGWQSHAAGMLYALLLLVFTFAVGANLARGRTELNCGCFGLKHEQKIGFKIIARNFALFMLALLVMIFGGGFLSLDEQSLTLQKFIIIEVLLPLTIPSPISLKKQAL